MVKGILGRKVGMTQVYDESGSVIPVTVIQAGPCHVLQIRSAERDGYDAVQLGFLDKKRPRGGGKRVRGSQARRSERGHVAHLKSVRAKRREESGVQAVSKADCEPKRFIRELRGNAADYQVGHQITVESLADLQAVDVTGTTKGRGYAGVIKRHHFGGQRASHGVKKVHRHLGTSGGVGTWRGGGRPKKGKCMPGQLGNVQVTARNLKVVRVDAENHLLLVRGAVPGPNGGYVVVRQTNKLS
jgi:large subunit ribosomal protein L3